MNTARRYWNYNKAQTSEPLVSPLRNSPEPFHKVTHRAIGDIPGCVPAVDIFIERTLEQVRAEIANDPAWTAYRNGDTKTYDRVPRKFFFSR